jgi:DNA modification methylase
MSCQILQGDAIEQLKALPDESVHCCVTSPPYWGLRDYGVEGQLGLEKTPDEYVAKMAQVFREVQRIMRPDATLWLNLGDSYAGSCKGMNADGTQSELSDKQASNKGTVGNRTLVTKNISGLKNKDLVGIPWRVAFALQADGWYLRQDIIWSKPNPMPENVTDRCTKSHEYIFLLTKSAKYFYDQEAIKEDANTPGSKPTKKISAYNYSGNNYVTGAYRNKRSVWTITTQPFSEAHFATFPPDLIRPMILAGCPVTGTVLDPFGGSGTTGMVAEEEGRNSILVELNPKYIEMIKRRTAQQGLFCK